MRHFATTSYSDHSAAIQFGENRRQTVIIILRPTIEWMVVAVGTSQQISHKKFAGEFRLLARSTDGAIEVRRADVMRVSRRQQDLAGELIVGHAVGNLLF